MSKILLFSVTQMSFLTGFLVILVNIMTHGLAPLEEHSSRGISVEVVISMVISIVTSMVISMVISDVMSVIIIFKPVGVEPVSVDMIPVPVSVLLISVLLISVLLISVLVSVLLLISVSVLAGVWAVSVRLLVFILTEPLRIVIIISIHGTSSSMAIILWSVPMVSVLVLVPRKEVCEIILIAEHRNNNMT